MLTSIPARLLHAAHEVAVAAHELTAALLVLTELGLELLCTEHDHRGALHQLGRAA